MPRISNRIARDSIISCPQNVYVSVINLFAAGFKVFFLFFPCLIIIGGASNHLDKGAASFLDLARD